VESDTLQDLYADLLTAEVRYRELSGVIKHKHPEMVQVTSKINELRSKIFQEIQKAVENARAERAVLIARERALEEAIDRYEKDAIQMNRTGVQYAILERDVETNRQLYNVLLTKIKEANITDEVTKTNLRLVQPASTPVKPVKPRKMLNLLLSLVLGSMTGVGLAFFLEYLDRTLRSREEVERLFEVPVLAEVPLEDSKEYPKIGKDGKYTVPSVLEVPMNSYFAEAFRILVANMSFSTVDRPRGIYLVTSSSPMEGKSTVTYNLGNTLARFGAKTLIVDCDLRRPMMRRIAGFKAKKGLSEILVVTFSTEIASGELGEMTIGDIHKLIEIHEMTIGDIHKLIEIQKKTGVLHYKNEEPLFTVSFHNGRIISVDSPTGSLESRLAGLLVQSGKITKPQAQIALSRWKSTSLRFEEVLLHLGFLSPEHLAGSLTLNLEENIRNLYSCEHANFIFQEGSDFIASASNFMAERAGNGLRDLNGASPKSTPFLAKRIRQHVVQVGKENLWLLPSGRIPPNPTEFLANKRMKSLLEILRGEFDIILLDSPPAATMSDAKVLARYCDAIIMVVKAGSTHLEEMRRAKEQLDSVQAPIVGAVLNMLDVKKDPYYYKHYVSKYQDYYANNTKRPKNKAKSLFSHLRK
jgi:Mrp family chromosome partitioning ATPase